MIGTTVFEQYHDGNGVATEFAFDFRVLDSAHLRVSDITNGEETLLVEGTDYTVRGIGRNEGGLVVLGGVGYGVLQTGSTLRIRRVTPVTQLVSLRTQGPYRPEAVEDALDRAICLIQEHFGAVTSYIAAAAALAGLPPLYTTASRPEASALPGASIRVKDPGQPMKFQDSAQRSDGEWEWVTRSIAE